MRPSHLIELANSLFLRRCPFPSEERKGVPTTCSVRTARGERNSKRRRARRTHLCGSRSVSASVLPAHRRRPRQRSYRTPAGHRTGAAAAAGSAAPAFTNHRTAPIGGRLRFVGVEYTVRRQGGGAYVAARASDTSNILLSCDGRSAGPPPR